MTSHSVTDEKNISIDDKAVSQDEYSRPSSASQKGEVVVPQEEEEAEEEQPTRGNDLTPDQEAQADVRSTFTAESGIPQAPDGGLHAWLKVFGGFLIYINIWYVSLLAPLPSITSIIIIIIITTTSVKHTPRGIKKKNP